MLQIREEQLRALSKIPTDVFAQRARLHLLKCWPEQCALRSESSIQASISMAIEQARHHGITSKRGVIRYLDVMYLLGDDFEKNPAMAWASSILHHATMPGWAKADRLWMEARKQAEGPQQGQHGNLVGGNTHGRG